MNGTTKALLSVFVLLLVSGGIYIATGNSNEKDNKASIIASITKKEVAEHKEAASCWTIIEDSVYDITSYIPRHSGGDNILSACGIDATEFFKGQKTGQEGGSNNHSSSAKSQLSSLKIGNLVD